MRLVSAGWTSASPTAGAGNVRARTASQAASPVWLCRTGQPKVTDPCAYDLVATSVTSGDAQLLSAGDLGTETLRTCVHWAAASLGVRAASPPFLAAADWDGAPRGFGDPELANQ